MLVILDPDRPRPAADALRMLDDGTGHKHDLAADGAKPHAPVDILEMQEIRCVEIADPVDRLARHQHAGARNRRYGGGAIGQRFGGEVECPEPRMARHQPMQAEGDAENLPRVGYVAPAAALLAAVRVHDQRADHADGRIGIKFRDQGRQRSRVDPAIGVEQQDRRTAGHPDADIARPGKAEIASGVPHDQARIVDRRLQAGDAVVGRRIVDDDNLHRPDFAGEQTFDGHRQEFAGVEIDDDGGDQPVDVAVSSLGRCQGLLGKPGAGLVVRRHDAP